MPDTLTQTERLILLNQYRILSIIDPSEKEGYEENINILEAGYELEYPNLQSGLEFSVSVKECEFVNDVLDVFDRIGYAIDDNKIELPKDLSWRAKFSGFDGNHEGNLLRYAIFVINKQEKFQRLKMSNFNSHCPTIGRYEQLISRWNQLTQDKQENLTEAIIKYLIES